MGEIRFVGTGEIRGYPYLVCKKEFTTLLKIEQTLSHREEIYTFSACQ